MRTSHFASSSSVMTAKTSIRRAPLLRGVATGILLALVLCEIGAVVIPGLQGSMRDLGAVLLLAYLPLALVRAGARARLLVAVLACAAAFPVLDGMMPAHVLWLGLQSAGTFAAFLTVLQWVRAVAGASHWVERVRHRLETMPCGQRTSAYMVGAFALGGLLATGAHAVLSAGVPADADDAQRRAAALATLRGLSYAAFWSPFFVAVAFVGHNSPTVPSWQIPAVGLLCGVSLVVAELAVRRTGWGAALCIGRAMQPLLAPAVAVAAVLGGLIVWAEVPAVEAIVVSMPLICAAYAVLTWPTSWMRPVRAAAQGIGAINDEVLLIAASVILAVVIGRLPLDEILGLQAMTGQLLAASPFLLFAGIGLAIIAVGLIGIHASVPAALAMAACAAFPGSFSHLALAEVIVIAWALATMVSPVGLTMMVAGRMFRVPVGQLMMSPNLVRALVLSVGSAALFAGLAPYL